MELDIIYRALTLDDLSPALLRDFRRHQVVTKCLRRIDGQWKALDIPFVDDWDESNRARKLREIEACIRGGDLALGALIGGELKGLSLVLRQPLGSRGQYRVLDSFHVSEEYRRHGIGRQLFLRSADWAKAMGGEKLYISAHSAVESQAFYRAMGCVDTVEPDPAHVAEEPCDCQLEYVL